MAIPKTYSFAWNLSELQADDFLFIQDSQDLEATLDNIALPKKYRKYITGAVIKITDGDYDAVWLCENGAYYGLSATYRALPFYRPSHWAKRNLPVYWLETCPDYQRKEKA